MRYYSTQRPIAPGTYPKEGAMMIENFDSKDYIPTIGHCAWGYIEYNRKLTQEEIGNYELTPAIGDEEEEEKELCLQRIPVYKIIQSSYYNWYKKADDALKKKLAAQADAEGVSILIAALKNLAIPRKVFMKEIATYVAVEEMCKKGYLKSNDAKGADKAFRLTEMGLKEFEALFRLADEFIAEYTEDEMA